MEEGAKVVKLYANWNVMSENKDHPQTGCVTLAKAKKLLFACTNSK